MEDLKEIVKLLSKNQTSKIEIIGQNPDSNSLFNQFYNGLYYDEFEDDEAAADTLYQSTPKDNRYIKLKYEFRKRLVNTVFFIDMNQPMYNEQQKTYINCLKNWSAAQILFSKYARKSAVKITLKNIRIAEKFGYTELILAMARVLRIHYSIYDVNKRKASKFQVIIDKQRQISELELIAEKYYIELISSFAEKRGGFSKRISLKAKEYSEDIEERSRDLKMSKQLEYHSNLLLIIRHEINKDYENVIIACQRAIIIFKKRQNKNAIIASNLRILVALISLKRFQDAEELFNKIIPDYPIGNYYWFILNELRIIQYFYTKDYQSALEIQIIATPHKNLKRLPISMQEGWKLYEAYIHLFIFQNLIDPTGYENKLKTFKLSKFLNDIPKGSKDKEGINIQILIIQVIFLLKNDKIDQAINRMQVLHQYCGKYLKKDHTYRSNVFIRMLIVLIRNQMHREAVNRKAAKYLKMLQEHPIEKSKQSIGVEVVPFEDLWELIIADTKNEFRFTPGKMRKVEAAFGTGRRGKGGK